MRTFKHGGVHPPDMKHLSAGAPLEEVAAPERLVLPVMQNVGSPPIPVVKPSDPVFKGQVIAEASGYVSVPLHSPVSGKVVGVERRMTTLGRICDHIIIENDGRDAWLEGMNREHDPRLLDNGEIIDIICDAGIVGMGGAAFPTHVKLSAPKGKRIDTLIINGVECEPYLTIDSRMMLERQASIAEGIGILKRVLGVKRTIVGVEANKRDAYAALKAALREHGDVEMILLEVKYPQGSEKQLIDAAIGCKVPSGRLPFDVGAVVHNVTTAYAVYEAVVMRRPMISRPLTVTGEGVERPANLIVPIGMSIGEVVARQGVKKDFRTIIMGGPMMGLSVYDPNFPVIKGTSGLLVLTGERVRREGQCIRCGRCIKACPVFLMPTGISTAVKSGEADRYEHFRVADCMECGSCAFACPAHIPLVHYIKLAKATLAAWKARQ